MISKNTFLRSTAALTVLCFLSTNLTASPLPAPAFKEAVFSSLVQKIEIPENLGRIQERFVPASPSVSAVIHIQDAHSSLEAQKHIYGILKYLEKQYQTNLLFLEGGMNELRPELLDFFQDAKLNAKALSLFEKKGLIGGTERFLYEEKQEGKSFSGYGIEESQLYGANLRAYRAVVSQKQISENFLKDLQDQILTRGSHVLGKELKDFFREYSFHQEHAEALPAYLKTLQKWAREKAGTDLKQPDSQLDWPQLVRFSRLQDLENQIDATQVKKEAEILKAWMKEKNIRDRAFEMLLEKAQANLKTESPRIILEKFYDRASAAGFSYEKYPELSKGLGKLVLQNELQASDLFDEIQRLSEKILNKLAASSEEKNLLQNYEYFLKLKKLFNLELLRADYLSITENPSQFRPSEIFKRVSAQPPATSLDALNDLFQRALSFYEGAVKRESAMYDNLIRETKKNKKPVSILITGGFHAPGLSEKLKEQGIAYVQITPHISDLKDTNDYEKLMTLSGAGKSSVNHPTLANPMSVIAKSDPAMGAYYRRSVMAVLDPLFRNLQKRQARLARIQNSPAAKGHGLNVHWSGNHLRASKISGANPVFSQTRAEVRTAGSGWRSEYEKKLLRRAFHPDGVIAGLKDIEVVETLSTPSTSGEVESDPQFFWPHAMAAVNGVPWRGENGNSFIKDRADAALLYGLDRGFRKLRGIILRVISNEGGRDFAPSFLIGVLSYFSWWAESTGHPVLNFFKKIFQTVFRIAKVDWWGDVLEVTNAFVKSKFVGAVSMGAFVPKDKAVSFPDFYLFRWAMRKDISIDRIQVSRNIIEDTEHNIKLLLENGKNVSDIKVALLIRPRHKVILQKLKELGVKFAPEDEELNIQALEKKAKEKGFYRTGNVFLIADGDMMPVFQLISGPEEERLDAVIGAGGSNEVETSALVAKAAGIPLKAMLLPSKALAEEVTDASIQSAPFSAEERQKLLDHNLYPSDATEAEKIQIRIRTKTDPYALNSHLTEEQRDVNHLWNVDELLTGNDGVFYAANLLRPGQVNPWLKSLDGIHFDSNTGLVTVSMVRAGLSGDTRVFRITFETEAANLRQHIERINLELSLASRKPYEQELENQLSEAAFELAKILAHFQEYDKANEYFEMAAQNATAGRDRASIRAVREYYEGLRILVTEKNEPNEKALKLFQSSIASGTHAKTDGPDGALTMAYLLTGQILEKLNALFVEANEPTQKREMAIRIDDYLRTRVTLAQKLKQNVSRERTEHDKIRIFLETGHFPTEEGDVGIRHEIHTLKTDLPILISKISSAVSQTVSSFISWVVNFVRQILQFFKRNVRKAKTVSGMDSSGISGPGFGGGRPAPAAFGSGSGGRPEIRAKAIRVEGSQPFKVGERKQVAPGIELELLRVVSRQNDFPYAEIIFHTNQPIHTDHLDDETDDELDELDQPAEPVDDLEMMVVRPGQRLAVENLSDFVIGTGELPVENTVVTIGDITDNGMIATIQLPVQRHEIRSVKKSVQDEIRRAFQYKEAALSRATFVHGLNRSLTTLFEEKDPAQSPETLAEAVRAQLALLQQLNAKIGPDSDSADAEAEKRVYASIDVMDNGQLQKLQTELLQKFQRELLPQFEAANAANDHATLEKLNREAVVLHKSRIKTQILRILENIRKKKINETALLSQLTALYENYMRLTMEYNFRYWRAVEKAGIEKISLVGYEGRVEETHEYGAFRILIPESEQEEIKIIRNYWVKSDVPGGRVYEQKSRELKISDLDKALRLQIHTLVSQQEDYSRILFHITALQYVLELLKSYGSKLTQYHLKQIKANLEEVLHGKGGLARGKVHQKTKGTVNLELVYSLVEHEKINQAMGFVRETVSLLQSRQKDIEGKHSGMQKQMDYIAHRIRQSETFRAAEALENLVNEGHYKEASELIGLLYQSHYQTIASTARQYEFLKNRIAQSQKIITELAQMPAAEKSANETKLTGALKSHLNTIKGMTRTRSEVRKIEIPGKTLALERYERSQFNKMPSGTIYEGTHIGEAGDLFAAQILRWEQEEMKKQDELLTAKVLLPKDAKVIEHMATGNTPWIGYTKKAEVLKTWETLETQAWLVKHGIDPNYKPDMKRVIVHPLDALFPQKRTDYHSFANILNHMFERLGIPQENRNLFYGDVKDKEGRPMTEKAYKALMADIQANGLLIEDYLRLETVRNLIKAEKGREKAREDYLRDLTAERDRLTRLFQERRIQREYFKVLLAYSRKMADELTGNGGAHIFISGVGPSYDGRGHIGFMEAGTPLSQELLFGLIGFHMAADHMKENGGMATMWAKTGKAKFGFVTYGFKELLKRPDVKVLGIATGIQKAAAMRRGLEGKGGDSQYPISQLQNQNITWVLDRFSAVDLRYKTNFWDFEDISAKDWTQEKIARLFITLSQQLGKPVSKILMKDLLTSAGGDEEEIRAVRKQNLVNLLSKFKGDGDAEKWQKLREKISKNILNNRMRVDGFSKRLNLKPGSKITFVNPHLDDDVLAMYPNIRQMVKEGHQVSVWYTAPGYTAVHTEYAMKALEKIASFGDQELKDLAAIAKTDAGFKALEKEYLNQLIKVLENARVPQNLKASNYDIWSLESSEEQTLRAKLLLLRLIHQRPYLSEKLRTARSLKGFIAILQAYNQSKPGWGSEDLKIMKDIKVILRFAEAQTSLMRAGVAYENINYPLNASWYGTTRSGMVKEKDVNDVVSVFLKDNPDLVITPKENFGDGGAHDNTKREVFKSTRDLKTLFEEVQRQGEPVSLQLLSKVYNRLVKDGKISIVFDEKHTQERKEFLNAFLGFMKSRKKFEIKIAGYRGVWDRTPASGLRDQVSVLYDENELDDMDWTFEIHFRTQSLGRQPVPDSGFAGPVSFSKQVLHNAAVTLDENRLLGGPVDKTITGILNFEYILDLDQPRAHREAKAMLEELESMRRPVERASATAVYGPVPYGKPNAKAVIRLVRDYNFQLEDIFTSPELHATEILNGSPRRHEIRTVVAAEAVKTPFILPGDEMTTITWEIGMESLSSEYVFELARNIRIDMEADEINRKVRELALKHNPKVRIANYVYEIEGSRVNIYDQNQRKMAVSEDLHLRDVVLHMASSPAFYLLKVNQQVWEPAFHQLQQKPLQVTSVMTPQSLRIKTSRLPGMTFIVDRESLEFSIYLESARQIADEHISAFQGMLFDYSAMAYGFLAKREREDLTPLESLVSQEDLIEDVLGLLPRAEVRKVQSPVSDEDLLRSQLAKSTNALEWFDLLSRYSPKDKSKKVMVTVQIDRGVTMKVPMMKDLLTDRNLQNAAYRYLAAWAYNLSIIYGTSFVGVGVPRQPDLVNINKIKYLLTNKRGGLSNIRESLTKRDKNPLGIRNYANAGRPIRFKRLADLTKAEKKKKQLSLGIQLLPSVEGVYLGVDIGGTGTKFTVIENGKILPLPLELSTIPTVQEDADKKVILESPQAYVDRMKERVAAIEKYLDKKFDGVGMDSPGAAEFETNRMVTLGQIPVKTKWNQAQVEWVGRNLPLQIAQKLEIDPSKVKIRNDMDGVLPGVASLLPRSLPEFWKETNGDFAFDWMGTGHGFQYALGGVPMNAPTEAGHMIFDFGKRGDKIFDTESKTSIPSMLRYARQMAQGSKIKWDAIQGKELKPLAEQAFYQGSDAAELKKKAIAEKVFQRFAEQYAANAAIRYHMSAASGHGNASKILFGGGIARGRTGDYLKGLAMKALEKYGLADKIEMTVMTDEAIRKAGVNPDDVGPIGSAYFIQSLLAAKQKPAAGQDAREIWQHLEKGIGAVSPQALDSLDLSASEIQERFLGWLEFGKPIQQIVQKLHGHGLPLVPIKLYISDDLPNQDDYGVRWHQNGRQEIQFVTTSENFKNGFARHFFISSLMSHLMPLELSSKSDLDAMITSPVGFGALLPSASGNSLNMVDVSSVALAFTQAYELRLMTQVGAAETAYDVFKHMQRVAGWPLGHLLATELSQGDPLFTNEIHNDLGIMNHLILISAFQGTPFYEPVLEDLKQIFPAKQVERALEYLETNKAFKEIVSGEKYLWTTTLLTRYIRPAHQFVGQEILRRKLAEKLGREIEDKIEWNGGAAELSEQILERAVNGQNTELDFSNAQIVSLDEQGGQRDIIPFAEWQQRKAGDFQKIKVQNLQLMRAEIRTLGRRQFLAVTTGAAAALAFLNPKKLTAQEKATAFEDFKFNALSPEDQELWYQLTSVNARRRMDALRNYIAQTRQGKRPARGAEIAADAGVRKKSEQLFSDYVARHFGLTQRAAYDPVLENYIKILLADGTVNPEKLQAAAAGNPLFIGLSIAGILGLIGLGAAAYYLFFGKKEKQEKFNPADLELLAGEENKSNELTYLYKGKPITLYNIAVRIARRNGLERAADVRLQVDTTFYKAYFDPEEPESSNIEVATGSKIKVRLTHYRHEIRTAQNYEIGGLDFIDLIDKGGKGTFPAAQLIDGVRGILDESKDPVILGGAYLETKDAAKSSDLVEWHLLPEGETRESAIKAFLDKILPHSFRVNTEYEVHTAFFQIKEDRTDISDQFKTRRGIMLLVIPVAKGDGGNSPGGRGTRPWNEPQNPAPAGSGIKLDSSGELPVFTFGEPEPAGRKDLIQVGSRSEIRTAQTQQRPFTVLIAENDMPKLRERAAQSSGRLVVVPEFGIGKDTAKLQEVIRREQPHVVVVRSGVDLDNDETLQALAALPGNFSPVILRAGSEIKIKKPRALELGLAAVRTNGSEESVAELFESFYANFLNRVMPNTFRRQSIDMARDPLLTAAMTYAPQVFIEAVAKSQKDGRGDLTAEQISRLFPGYKVRDQRAVADIHGQMKIGFAGWGIIPKVAAAKIRLLGDHFGTQAQLMAWSPSLESGTKTAPAGVASVSKNEMLQKATVISLHLPTEAGAFLTEDDLRVLAARAGPNNPIAIINTSRLASVDHAALLKIMRELKASPTGLHLYYYSDIDLTAKKQPIEVLDILRTEFPENVFMTNHIGAFTAPALAQVEANTVDQTVKLFETYEAGNINLHSFDYIVRPPARAEIRTKVEKIFGDEIKDAVDRLISSQMGGAGINAGDSITPVSVILKEGTKETPLIFTHVPAAWSGYSFGIGKDVEPKLDLKRNYFISASIIDGKIVVRISPAAKIAAPKARTTLKDAEEFLNSRNHAVWAVQYYGSKESVRFANPAFAKAFNTTVDDILHKETYAKINPPKAPIGRYKEEDRIAAEKGIFMSRADGLTVVKVKFGKGVVGMFIPTTLETKQDLSLLDLEPEILDTLRSLRPDLFVEAAQKLVKRILKAGTMKEVYLLAGQLGKIEDTDFISALRQVEKFPGYLKKSREKQTLEHAKKLIELYHATFNENGIPEGQIIQPEKSEGQQVFLAKFPRYRMEKGIQNVRALYEEEGESPVIDLKALPAIQEFIKKSGIDFDVYGILEYLSTHKGESLPKSTKTGSFKRRQFINLLIEGGYLFPAGEVKNKKPLTLFINSSGNAIQGLLHTVQILTTTGIKIDGKVWKLPAGSKVTMVAHDTLSPAKEQMVRDKFPDHLGQVEFLSQFIKDAKEAGLYRANANEEKIKQRLENINELLADLDLFVAKWNQKHPDQPRIHVRASNEESAVLGGASILRNARERLAKRGVNHIDYVGMGRGGGGPTAGMALEAYYNQTLTGQHTEVWAVGSDIPTVSIADGQAIQNAQSLFQDTLRALPEHLKSSNVPEDYFFKAVADIHRYAQSKHQPLKIEASAASTLAKLYAIMADPSQWHLLKPGPDGRKKVVAMVLSGMNYAKYIAVHAKTEAEKEKMTGTDYLFAKALYENIQARADYAEIINGRRWHRDTEKYINEAIQQSYIDLNRKTVKNAVDIESLRPLILQWAKEDNAFARKTNSRSEIRSLKKEPKKDILLERSSDNKSLDKEIRGTLTKIRKANLPKLIAEAHNFALEKEGQVIDESEIIERAKTNPFFVTGLNITQVEPGKIKIKSQLGQFVAPRQNSMSRGNINQLMDRLEAIAKLGKVAQMVHTGQGGSSATGNALRKVGIVPELFVLDQTDPAAFNAMLESITGLKRETGEEEPLWQERLAARLKEVMPEILWVYMALGMTSEEAVINLGITFNLMEKLGIMTPALKSKMQALTLDHSSLHEFMINNGFGENIFPLQLDGTQSVPGRGAGPAATPIAFYPLYFHYYNKYKGDRKKIRAALERWNDRAFISPKTLSAFQGLAASMNAYAQQGKDHFTLVLPSGLEGAAEWTKQIFEESGGIKNKGIYNRLLAQEATAHKYNIVVDDPLDLKNYNSPSKSNRVFWIVEVEGAPFSQAQKERIAALRKAGHPVLTLKVPGKDYLSAYMQGLHNTVASLLGFLERRNFVTQPSVEGYKAVAKKMIVEAMVEAGILKSEEEAKNPAVYFKALLQWVPRENPEKGRIDQSETFRKVLGREKAQTPDGQIQVYFDKAKINFNMVRQELLKIGGSEKDAAAVVAAILKGVQRTPDENGNPKGIEISHGGDLSHSQEGRAMKRDMQSLATAWVRRPFKAAADVSEIPVHNHEYHELITNKSGVTVILMPRSYAKPHLGIYHDDYIRAQVLATKKALEDNGRTVILITYPANDAAGREVLNRLKKEVSGDLSRAEGLFTKEMPALSRTALETLREAGRARDSKSSPAIAFLQRAQMFLQKNGQQGQQDAESIGRIAEQIRQGKPDVAAGNLGIFKSKWERRMLTSAPNYGEILEALTEAQLALQVRPEIRTTTAGPDFRGAAQALPDLQGSLRPMKEILPYFIGKFQTVLDSFEMDATITETKFPNPEFQRIVREEAPRMIADSIQEIQTALTRDGEQTQIPNELTEAVKGLQQLKEHLETAAPGWAKSYSDLSQWPAFARDIYYTHAAIVFAQRQMNEIIKHHDELALARAEIRQAEKPGIEFLTTGEGNEVLRKYLSDTGISFESLEDVYEFVAQKTVGLLPREAVQAALAAIQKHSLEKQTAADGKMAKLKQAVRKALGNYGNLLDRKQSGEKPIELVLPVDLSARPEDLALLITLLVSKDDTIHLLLQGETVTESAGQELGNRIQETLAQWNVRPELLRQIQIHAISNPKNFTVQTQRIIGGRNASDKERGIASHSLADLNQLQSMPGVYEMLSPERLKHPYAMALLAAAYLRDARDAAKMGSVLNLEKWMQTKGIKEEALLEGISLAVNALQHAERAA